MSLGRVVVLLHLALLGFAANSLLARTAMQFQHIEPLTFTAIRLLAGATMLAVLVGFRRSSMRGGSWVAAMALVGYALAFSLAYHHIAAGVGALILFAVVQVTMVGRAVVGGERPRAVAWTGVVLALAGLAGLLWPSGDAGVAISLLGAGLMAAAGVCWGIYTLCGRSEAQPIIATTGNFLRAAPLALLPLLCVLPQAHADLTGVGLAAISGAITSGLAYAAWYAVLPQLSATLAAVLQLLVPVLAALAGVLVLSEPLSLRLVLAGVVIVVGIGLVMAGRQARR